ncbi:MAG: LPXTG cell wall anchor domain-containing protein [Candidatus Saccharimonadales bacterium]
MKRFSQTLRIGLALFLAVFGTSAIPSAAAYALEDAGTTTEVQSVETPQPTVAEVQTPPPAVVDEAPLPVEPPVLPLKDDALESSKLQEPEQQLVEEQTYAPQNLREVQLEILPSIAATQPISAKALTDHDCNETEWHFVINQIDSEVNAPAFITVNFSNGNTVVVAKNKFTGGVAHYTTTSNLSSTVESATTTIYSSWSGQFNLSHGPCNEPEENTVPIPAAPEPAAATCEVNGSLTLPADTADIKWTISPAYTGPGTYDVTATAQNGKTFAGTNGNTTVTFEDIVVQSKLSGEQCPPPPFECSEGTEWVDINKDEQQTEDECFEPTEGICHALGQENKDTYIFIEKISPAGIFNGHLGEGHQSGEDIIPPFTYKGVTYSQNWDTVGQTLFNNGCVVKEVTPAEPTFVNPTCEAAFGRVIIPIKVGVVYKINGIERSAGSYSYSANTTVVVTAEAMNAAYTLDPEAVASWEYDFDAAPVNCTLGDTDVCPNLQGSQVVVPTGYVRDAMTGNCTQPQVLAAITVTPAQQQVLPASLPATGASDTSNIYLILGMAFSALTYFAMLRRYQEA